MTWISADEMEQRICWLRQREGYDGPPLGSDTPVLAAFSVPPERTTCQFCARLLTKAQRIRHCASCSRSCGGRARQARRRRAS